MQNGYIESFNDKFRDECLNEHWFNSPAQARDVIVDWRRDYNEVDRTAVAAAFAVAVRCPPVQSKASFTT